jgi:hypothetical protein
MMSVIADHMIDDLGIANTRRLHRGDPLYGWIGDRIHDAALIGDGAPFAGIGAGFR